MGNQQETGIPGSLETTREISYNSLNFSLNNLLVEEVGQFIKPYFMLRIKI